MNQCVFSHYQTRLLISWNKAPRGQFRPIFEYGNPSIDRDLKYKDNTADDQIHGGKFQISGRSLFAVDFWSEPSFCDAAEWRSCEFEEDRERGIVSLAWD